jgi:hypothetical protein
MQTLRLVVVQHGASASAMFLNNVANLLVARLTTGVVKNVSVLRRSGPSKLHPRDAGEVGNPTNMLGLI